MPDFRPESDNLPQGVTSGTRRYFESKSIANDYDQFFAQNRLFDFDETILREQFPLPKESTSEKVADFGCGTGRTLLPLLQRGYEGIAIDLSEDMLDIVADKVTQQDLEVECLAANLCELDMLPNNYVDHGICMFSTLGMVQGRNNRRQALREFRRVIKPQGKLVLHVHNLWYTIHESGGTWWLLQHLAACLKSDANELGDRHFHYRGIDDMYLHVFRLPELLSDLKNAGFNAQDVIALSASRDRPLRLPKLLPAFRANGWIVVCQ